MSQGVEIFGTIQVRGARENNLTSFTSTARRSRSTHRGVKINSGYEGVIPKFKRLYLSKDAEKMAAKPRGWAEPDEQMPGSWPKSEAWTGVTLAT